MDFKNKVNRITRYRQNIVAKDVRNKNKKLDERTNNRLLFKQGSDWFSSGLPLEEATEELRRDMDFVNGYNRAKRISEIEVSLYNLGAEYFNDGISIELIPNIYRNNPIVIRGYEDAKAKIKEKIL